MKKNTNFVRNNAYENALMEIKRYLTSPPVLGALIQGKPFILYICALEYSPRELLAQNNDEGKEVALYYLTQKLLGA